MRCLICNSDFKSNPGLGKHIKSTHRISTQEYFDQYIDSEHKRKFCPICHKENRFVNFIVGYNLGCCTEHTNLIKYGVTNVYASEYAKQKMRQTKLLRYGDANYNNREKATKTVLQNYGVKNISLDSKIRAKIHATNMKNLGVAMPCASQTIQERMRDTKETRYGNRHYTNRDKFYNTMKEKGFISTDEKAFEKILIEHGIEYRPQYNKDPRYPFHCDFYLPRYDMFVEINIYPAHGPHPFNPTNPDDLKLLHEWKERATTKSSVYSDWITRWTEKDVTKRTIAKTNHLNYIELFSASEIQEFFKEKFNIVVDVDRIYQNL